MPEVLGKDGVSWTDRGQALLRVAGQTLSGIQISVPIPSLLSQLHGYLDVHFN